MSDTEYSDVEAPQSEPIPTGSGVDTDLLIDDMSYEDARNYVMSFLVTEKRTKAALQEKEAEFHKWNERLAFAERKGMTDILEEATRHLHFLVDEKAKLKAELEALQRKNTVLKEKLQHKAQTTGTPSSAHAEQLLSDLEQLADVDEYKLNEAMKQQAAEDELAKLKAKLGMQ